MKQTELSKHLSREPEKAMARILEEYGNLMYAIALKILKNPQDAEDCVSDALIRLWRNHRKLRKEASLKSYICAITRNAAIDALRSRQKRMEQSLEDELNQILPVPDTTAARLDSMVIRQQLTALGEPTCSIFLRRYWCCESIDEIAAALHMSRGAVEGRLFRGKKQLKELMMQGGFAYEDE